MRALLLRGEGRVFSAGADAKPFAGKGAAEMRPLIESFLELGHRIEALPVSTVAAVHGTCMAGGLELALFCDLIWAANHTMMGTRALAAAKAIARSYAEGGLRRADTEQARSAVDLFDTADAQRGIAHFLEHGTTDTEFAGA